MSALTIRRAAAGDGPALARLAALDCARPLAGEILLAEISGEPAAALSLADGRVVADPFRPTAELLGLLRMRREQLDAKGRSEDRRRLLRPSPQPAR